MIRPRGFLLEGSDIVALFFKKFLEFHGNKHYHLASFKDKVSALACGKGDLFRQRIRRPFSIKKSLSLRGFIYCDDFLLSSI
jgi:hypothetical protein